MTSSKRFTTVWVLVPLLLIAAVASLAGLRIFQDMKVNQAKEEEAKLRAQAVEEVRRQAFKNLPQPPPEAVAPAEGKVEDDLSALPPGQKPTPSKSMFKFKAPADKAYFGLKMVYDQLERANENAAKKFRIQKIQLDGEYHDGKPTDEAQFVAQCQQLSAEIFKALRQPENQ